MSLAKTTSLECFSRLDTLIKKVVPSSLPTILQQLRVKQEDTQKTYNSLASQQAKKRVMLQKLKEEVDDNQRRLDDLKWQAERECKKIEQAIFMQKNLDELLRGADLTCICCLENTGLSESVSCPVCYKHTCFKCFDHLDDRVYETRQKNKKCASCRHVFVTLEVVEPIQNQQESNWIDDYFPNGSSFDDDYSSSSPTSRSFPSVPNLNNNSQIVLN